MFSKRRSRAQIVFTGCWPKLVLSNSSMVVFIQKNRLLGGSWRVWCSSNTREVPTYLCRGVNSDPHPGPFQWVTDAEVAIVLVVSSAEAYVRGLQKHLHNRDGWRGRRQTTTRVRVSQHESPAAANAQPESQGKSGVQRGRFR